MSHQLQESHCLLVLWNMVLSRRLTAALNDHLSSEGFPLWPATWSSMPGHHLQCWHLVIPTTAPLPIQSLDDSPKKAGEDDSSLELLPPLGENWMKFLALTLDWPRPDYCRHLSSDPADGSYLSSIYLSIIYLSIISFSLLPFLCDAAFKINK